MSTEVVLDENPKSGILSTGLALFSMFFGAGNIIFPLIVGRISGTETTSAIMGLGLSAVAFPFLGLIAMMLFSGNITAFLNRLGKWPALILLFILQMSQGPVGAMPRLITLMHASIKPYFPEFSLGLFSVTICALLFFLTIRPQKIIHLLGSILTPFLLLALAVLIIIGAIGAPQAKPVFEGSLHHFSMGLKMGYQTMDLTAALLFATLIIPHLSKSTKDPGQIRRRMTQSSLIASGLLLATYIGLCWIAAHYTEACQSVAPEDLLQSIAVQILGPMGGFVSAVAVFLACLTTAISLATVFSQYLKKDLLRTGSEGFSLGLTLLITAAMANLGFKGIVSLWGPLLEILYPSLIVLCVMNIAHRLYQIKPLAAPVFFALGITVGDFFMRTI